MTRPKKPRGSRRGRQLRAARLRAEGLSLRQIAKEIGVKSPSTVANDLRDMAKLSNLPVQRRASRGPVLDSELDSAEVIPLRRKA